MARGDGGGGAGAFGWTVLGILVGVTATLAVQTLVGGRGASQSHDEVTAVSEPAAAAPEIRHVAPPPALPTPPKLAAEAPKAAATPQTDQQVQDDADAVGMTSRARPAEAPAPAPAAAQN